jgi:hypothetical protein
MGKMWLDRLCPTHPCDRRQKIIRSRKEQGQAVESFFIDVEKNCLKEPKILWNE